MKWIIRGRVKVDRVACPWLIKEFIDPKAKFRLTAGQDGERDRTNSLASCRA